MRLSRLLLLPFLVSAAIAPIAAQSTAAPTQPPPQTTLNLPQNAPEFRLQLPELQFPGVDRTGQNAPRIGWRQPSVIVPMPLAGQQSSTCYFIEAYRFARVTPDSDAVKLTGVSTCQPAAQFAMKDVTGPR
jgi:hypothetical protein